VSESAETIISGCTRWLIAAVIAAASPGCDWLAQPHEPTRNLVLISLDTVAPRRTGVYGGPRNNTPTLAALAARGARFTNAFSTASWTAPAHASMLTGCYASTIHPGGPRSSALYQLAPRLLAEYFAEAGFQTTAFTGGGWVAKAIGADRGFQTYDEGVFSYVRMPNPVQWIKDHGRDKPFFYFYHTYIAHVPYRDERYARELDGGRLKTIWTGDDFDAEKKTWRLPLQVCCQGMDATPREKEFLLARYDGDIGLADEAVAEIWKALGEIGMQEQTTVIVTSDHGEEFWEHTNSAARHGHSLYDELVRIPLIWFEPGMKARVVDAPVSLIDLVPTILARFRMKPAHHIDGVDLSPLLDGASRWPAASRPLFMEQNYTDEAEGPLRWRITTPKGVLIETPEPAIQRGKFPLPLSAPVELYLPTDARQSENRASVDHALVAELAAELARHRRTTDLLQGPLQPWSSLKPDLVKQLRALGYVE
jgi:arylsulfatase A-like enzyme